MKQILLLWCGLLGLSFRAEHFLSVSLPVAQGAQAAGVEQRAAVLILAPVFWQEEPWQRLLSAGAQTAQAVACE